MTEESTFKTHINSTLDNKFIALKLTLTKMLAST